MTSSTLTRGETRASRVPAGGARPSGRRGARPRQGLVAWIFLLPTLIVVGLFTVVPGLFALAFSFTDIGLRDIRDPLQVEVVGTENFTALLTNPDFLRSIGNTVLFVVIGVPLTIGIGLALAILLGSGIRRLRPVFRAAIYLPVIANIVAASVIWKYALTYEGPVNEALAAIGIAGPNWLGDPAWGVTSVILLTVWRNVGTAMVLFLAGLQAVPEEVYEAAAIDGAGPWRRIVHMTLPLLRPTTLLVTVLITVMYMNIFEEPYLLTGGGPLDSTRSISLWVYQQFGYGNIAASMAGSFVLILLVAAVSVVQFRMLRPKH
ncbi:multiple sugar transport system permease protein [Microbacterium sp. SORGH_AS428]|uniref:carbohydrate ABC transporter permease n=1 Tax=Microbacterium sp. SORGH_AS_0428 TaxID=3041788 RepID=UPI00286494CF|nr:sugar ABC transporter permease [Microbacterium sp. SORGH_AS_0428]MDR6198910.1 multiple sugar transport system permease protein [Microbacterium sp. SORGH_AS_0428]